ncbi:MAG: ABC transporter ATP-binding protein, partial [Clostridia bacterium]|nr:ABC transporter ATP-binding protein [Clostridia bacterium]
DVSKTRVSAERLSEVLEAEEEHDAVTDTEPDMRGDIVFDRVSFAYDGETVLKDVSFEIPAGSTFGILGNTGSGKSTLCYLLDRLYDVEPENGCITISGVDIRTIRRNYLRQNVGLVLQEPFLFSKTIAENIAISRSDASMEDIRRSASIADVDESIMEFSKGYDTIVGERGVTLSGGQKQRVAIARTLMCGSPIMVFDDSLSAVDLTTDARIRDALRSGTDGATVILISHRINTLMDADRILVLDNGRAAEYGTHEELLALGGIYKRTYDLQSAAASGKEEA